MYFLSFFILCLLELQAGASVSLWVPSTLPDSVELRKVRNRCRWVLVKAAFPAAKTHPIAVGYPSHLRPLLESVHATPRHIDTILDQLHTLREKGQSPLIRQALSAMDTAHHSGRHLLGILKKESDFKAAMAHFFPGPTHPEFSSTIPRKLKVCSQSNPAYPPPRLFVEKSGRGHQNSLVVILHPQTHVEKYPKDFWASTLLHEYLHKFDYDRLLLWLDANLYLIKSGLAPDTYFLKATRKIKEKWFLFDFFVDSYIEPRALILEWEIMRILHPSYADDYYYSRVETVWDLFSKTPEELLLEFGITEASYMDWPRIDQVISSTIYRAELHASRLPLYFIDIPQ